MPRDDVPRRISGRPQAELASLGEAWNMDQNVKEDVQKDIDKVVHSLTLHVEEATRFMGSLNDSLGLCITALERLEGQLRALEARTWRGRWRTLRDWWQKARGA